MVGPGIRTQDLSDESLAPYRSELSGQPINNLQELLTELDKLFNTTGNRVVAVNIFNSYSQREDVSVQDYSIGIEQLFYRSYPGVDPNQSIFLMDRFISGLQCFQKKYTSEF